MEYNQLKTLAINSVKASFSQDLQFSHGEETIGYEALDNALRNEFQAIAGDYKTYRENKNLIFSLIEETIDELLPERVRNTYAMFAETRTYAQGTKPVFNVKTGKARARQFVTRVALAGIYETFKLDKTSFTVETSAYGGAAEIGLEEFLDGRVNFAELTDIILQGLEDAVYEEITKAMVGIVASLQPANKHQDASFTVANFDKLLNKARIDGAVSVLTSFEIASELIPADKWISDIDRAEVRNNGYIAKYKGADIIILPQYHADLAKTQLGVDPSFAWLLPSGAMDEKPVKVAFEGSTITREVEQNDWSKKFECYKKFGVNLIHTNQVYVYRALDLAQ
ncbi:MAG: hypothetical protein ACRCZZ_06095 [Phocaeicola sp.]